MFRMGMQNGTGNTGMFHMGTQTGAGLETGPREKTTTVSLATLCLVLSSKINGA